MPRIPIALAIAALAGLVVPAHADEALDALNRGDYFVAFKAGSAGAAKSEPEAQYVLGKLYANAFGVARDYKAAASWYQRAAEQNYAPALDRLGALYEFGNGVALDVAQSVALYRKSAEQGNASGQDSLGTMYSLGRGVPQDYAVARTWYQRAADQGDATAQYNLAVVYRDGEGVRPDYAKAFALVSQAAAHGNVGAISDVGYMYESGFGVARSPQVAAQWYAKAADMGNALAQYNLANLYEAGRGVMRDRNVAAGWYWRSLNGGNQEASSALAEMVRAGFVDDPFASLKEANDARLKGDYATAVTNWRRLARWNVGEAETNLGYAYANGEGVAKDPAMALAWFRRGAEHGDAVGQAQLGFALSTGYATPVDPAKARELFDAADKQGQRRAPLGIGLLYSLKANATQDDLERAAFWFRKAADLGLPEAQHNLGEAYRDGRGVPVDWALARQWLLKASTQGYAAATTSLAALNKPLVLQDGMAAYNRGDYAIALGTLRAFGDSVDVAMLALGYMYEDGKGVTADPVEAAEWYRKAAGIGNPAAHYALGSLYERGKGVKKNLYGAIGWYAKAAWLDSPDGAKGLARVLAEDVAFARSSSLSVPVDQLRDQFAEAAQKQKLVLAQIRNGCTDGVASAKTPALCSSTNARMGLFVAGDSVKAQAKVVVLTTAADTATTKVGSDAIRALLTVVLPDTSFASREGLLSGLLKNAQANLPASEIAGIPAVAETLRDGVYFALIISKELGWVLEAAAEEDVYDSAEIEALSHFQTFCLDNLRNPDALTASFAGATPVPPDRVAGWLGPDQGSAWLLSGDWTDFILGLTGKGSCILDGEDIDPAAFLTVLEEQTHNRKLDVVTLKSSKQHSYALSVFDENGAPRHAVVVTTEPTDGRKNLRVQSFPESIVKNTFGTVPPWP